MASVFNFEMFALEHGIPTYSSGYKQCRKGWVQIQCPFCYALPHLGFHNGKGYFNCYSCGYHSIYDVFDRLGLALTTEVRDRYTNNYYTNDQVDAIRQKVEKCLLPKHNTKPSPAHKSYLKSRGLRWKELRDLYDVRFTDQYTETGYSWRVLIPVYHESKLVSFQARAIGSQSQLRYRTCPVAKEARSIKDCLYGLGQAVGDSCVVTEGVVDQWKLGAGAVSTFGIDYSTGQVELLRKYKKVFILFDEEEQAQAQAEKLSYELDLLGTETEILIMSGAEDPGALTMKQGRELMQDILS